MHTIVVFLPIGLAPNWASSNNYNLGTLKIGGRSRLFLGRQNNQPLEIFDQKGLEMAIWHEILVENGMPFRYFGILQ